MHGKGGRGDAPTDDETPPASLGADRFRQILDGAPDAIVIVERDGVISYVNRQVSPLFGYPESELLGAKLERLLPERHRAAHRRHFERYFDAPTARPMSTSVALAGLRADGTEIDVEVSLSPIRTGSGLHVAAAIRDIRDRRRIEADARISADRLATAVDSIEDAIAVFSSDDRLVLCNSACRRIFASGVAGPVTNMPFERLLDAWIPELALASEGDRDRFREARLAERGQDRAVFDVRTKVGQSLRVNLRRTLDGGLVQTFWDLTDDVRRKEELQAARRAAEEGSAAKSEFLSSMSHELRTPLNAILGFAQLLQRDRKEPLSARHTERASHIVKGGEHLLRLIDDILDLSRIEAGRISLSTEPVSVLDVIEEVRTTLESAAQRNNVSMDIGPLTGGAGLVSVDRTRFAQILMNLGSNAIKYNRPGGTVRFEGALAEDEVRITVVDTGLGIPADKQHKIFQPFQRAGHESGPIEGTGIGLVIARRLAEAMRGRVGFESVPGAGSRFWVDVPAALPRVRTKAPDVAVGPASASPRATLRVLYIEDNPANIAFMRDAIESIDGFELSTSPTAEMGLELALAATPDVVLMDINLPGMSGLDALRALRRDARTSDIPVVALTAAASERDRQRGIQAGFHRYLTKPVKVDELHATLEELAEAKAARISNA